MDAPSEELIHNECMHELQVARTRGCSSASATQLFGCEYGGVMMEGAATYLLCVYQFLRHAFGIAQSEKDSIVCSDTLLRFVTLSNLAFLRIRSCLGGLLL